MFSMHWPGGKPPGPPLNSRQFFYQNDLAYPASEKLRLGKVEEVAFLIFWVLPTGGGGLSGSQNFV